MADPRRSLNPATHSVGFTAKLVTVRSVSEDGKTAMCVDRQNVQAAVPMLVQRSKGPLPAPGETWLITQDLGLWLFAAIVATSSGQFLGGDGSSPGGARVTISATAPASPATGDIWVNGASGNAVFWWNGTSWVSAQFGTQAIADGAITRAKVAKGSLTTAELAPDAGITAGQVAFSVTEIGGVRIFTGTSQPPNPAPGDLWVNPDQDNALYFWDSGKWTGLLFGAGAIEPASLTTFHLTPDAGITDGQVDFTARDIGGVTTSVSSVQPPHPAIGDLWFDGTSSYVLRQWDGTTWTPYQFGTQAIQALSVTAALIAANTITAAQIAAGTITATQIAAGTITATQLAAGIVYAGIVDATTILGATLDISSGSGASAVDVHIDGATGDMTWSKYTSPKVTIRQILHAGGVDLVYKDPGSGNPQGALIYSNSPTAGTDGFGYSYLKGVACYSGNIAAMFTGINDGFITLGDVNSPGGLAAFIQANGGAGSAQGILTLVSDGAVAAELQLLSRSPDLSKSICILLGPGGATRAGTAFLEVQGSALITGATELDNPLTMKNGSNSSTLSAATDGHLKFSREVELPDESTPTTPGAGTKLYAVAGHAKYVAEDGGAYNTGRSTAFAAGQTIGTSVTSFTALTGMSVPVGAGVQYRFRVLVQLNANTSAGQWQIEVTGPATTSVNYGFRFTSAAGVTGANVNRTALSTAGSVALSGPAASVAGAYWAEVEGQVTPSAGGSLSVSGKTTVAGDDWDVETGSYIEVYPVN